MAGPLLDAQALVRLVDDELQGQYQYMYNTEDNPFVGGEYRIYALVDQGRNHRVSVRIPKAAPGSITALRIEMEADIRRKIDAEGLQRFQPLLAWNSTAANVLRSPFLIMGWADGSPLQWTHSIPPLKARQGVLEALANVSLDLLRINRPGVSALEWMTAKIDRKISRATANELPHGTVSECERQKSLISRYWMAEMDDAPHVLVHGDLSPANIIVSSGGVEVASVIDFGWAEMVPLQYAAEYPKFLTFEPIETDAGFRWSARKHSQMDRDRQHYLACVKDRAEREGGLALQYHAALARVDEVNRYWWCAAASRSDVHRAMTMCDWDPQAMIDAIL